MLSYYILVLCNNIFYCLIQIKLQLQAEKKTCSVSAPAWHDSSSYTYKNNDNNSPSSICPEMPSLKWKMIKIWKRFSVSAQNLLKSSSTVIIRQGSEQPDLQSRRRRRRNLPETNKLPGFLLAVTPPPLNLLCARVRARLHVRRDGRRQMACHPVLLCSLRAADMFPHHLLFCRVALTREVPGDEHGGQDGALQIQTHIQNQTTSNQEIHSVMIYVKKHISL